MQIRSYYRLKRYSFPLRPSHSVYPTLRDNTAAGRLELRFPARPGPALLQMLHASQHLPEGQRWQWDRVHHCWWAHRTDAARQFGLGMLGVSGLRPDESPLYPVSKWSSDFALGLTRLPYAEWLEEKMAAATAEEPVPVES